MKIAFTIIMNVRRTLSRKWQKKSWFNLGIKVTKLHSNTPSPSKVIHLSVCVIV